MRSFRSLFICLISALLGMQGSSASDGDPQALLQTLKVSV